MTRRTIITLFFAVVVSAINSFASPPSAQTIDSLRSDLSQAKTAVDSLHILYDIYDLSPVSDYRVVLEELRDAALSAGDTNALLDIIRRSASSNASDNNSCPYWDNMLLSLPPSRERDETALFMAIQRTVHTAIAQSQEERLATIAQFIAEYDREDNEPADDDKAAAILRLYTLIIYLSTETNGSMQSDYIDQLGKLIADIDLYALKNQYYTRAANYYTTLGLAKKAIEANSKLLNCIDDLEKEKRKSGRNYRSYDRNRYSCYRRMLYNASALSREEIEESYANLGRIASKSESLTRYYEADDTAHAFYYMAVDQPLNALPHLQNLLKDGNLPVHKKTRILWMLRKAYAQTGDKAGELQALSDYNDLLAAYNEIDASQKYRELQIKYDVHKLKAEKANLELEKRDSNLRTTRRSLFMTGGMLIAVAILLFILFYYFRRSRNLYTKLSKTVDILEKERDELQRVQKEFIAARDRAEIANRAKDDFLHNMSHELRTPLNAIIGFSNVIVHKMPADMKASMDRYSSHIDKNARQLENLINDVLFLSSINPNLTDISSETISIGQIFDNVIDNICNSPHPGVTVNVDETMSRRHITTDRNKVELILGKLLANALKFTDKGHIDMAAMINAEDDTVIFTVTDSGCGIPPEKKDEIFDRFTKLNSFVPGAGLGLYISRQVANMLGGTIKLDTTYIYGAKFVLTIPRNISGSQTYTERFAFSASR